jgi:exopolysaccharide biosynthesis polyprenyl glycosylphosphotransferase
LTTRHPPAGSSLTGFERAEWIHHDLALVPPLGTAFPIMDGLVLLLGVLLLGQGGPIGYTYTILALALMIGGDATRGRINPRLSDDLPRLLGLLVLPVLLVAPFFDPSELGAFVVVLPAIVLFVLITRGAMYWLVRTARARQLVVEPTLIVGIGQLGLKMAKTLSEHPEFGLRPVGFLGRSHQSPRAERESPEPRTADRLPLPLLGPVSQLARIAREYQIRRVIIAFDRTSEQEMIPILRESDRLPVEIHVMPRFFELGVAPAGSTTDDVWGIPLVRLRRSARRSFAWRGKRVFDVVLTSALLLLTAPLLIVAVIAVAATSRGPVLFRQVRVGQRSQLFKLLKFRTLHVNDDGDTTWTTEGDRRVTPVGRFLRRTCIDELPQLINVLWGQMSLVGPRPERPHFATGFCDAIEGYGDRQRVPAGLTGWAQVHGLRGDTSITERADFDNHYVEHWSLWQDTVIIARTIGAVFRGGGH